MPSERPTAPWAQCLLYPGVRLLAYLVFKLGWGLKVSGVENVPTSGPLIVAPNHQSYADPPLVGVAIPREVHFLAKQELFVFKPFGWIIRCLNAHPLNRAGDIAAFREAARIIKAGGAIIMFPEGRRMDPGVLGTAKAGVGMLARLTRAPVVPVYIHNSGYILRLRRVSVRFGEKVDPAAFESHDELAAEVMRRIARMKEDADRS